MKPRNVILSVVLLRGAKMYGAKNRLIESLERDPSLRSVPLRSTELRSG